MAASPRALIDVAGAILDGAEVDWASAESSVEKSERELLGPLRVVAALANVHRRQPEPPKSAGAATHLRVILPGTPPPREHWGHLRVLERIGRGAFGEVYRAWDTRLDREVALKVLPAAAASDAPRATTIIEEGRLLARVRHPNVVTIYGAERIGDQVGLWMEFVKGVTLAQAIEQGKTFSTSEALAIGVQLCAAVAAVHAAGLLHRDIKAQNVMLAEEGRLVLMDFGTGREQGDGSSAGLAGTPLYLAPELLAGAEPTVRSDIYSVGVLLYHLFTSSFPVKAASFHDLKQAHVRGDRLSLAKARPDLRRKLTTIIERALHPHPEHRQPNALALAGDLTAVARRPRLIPMAAALAIATAVILIAWITSGTRDQQGQRVTPAATLPASGAGTAATAIERPVIAVLPLTNLSGEPDSDYFADGLTDEIIRNLAVVNGLEVRSRTSSFAFKGKPRNLRDVGEQLGVNLVVEGSIMRSGSRLRINAQLVQVAGDVPVWAERFDRDLEDIFAIQDEISRAIVNSLRLTLGTTHRRYETNLEAYELYLRARGLVERSGTFPALQAITLFEQALARDPSYVPAYAGLADAYAGASDEIREPIAILPETALSLMAPAAETALRLDPMLAEAHAAMGLLHSRKLEWQKAEESFQRAIDLNPGLTHITTRYTYSTLVPLGKLAEAEQRLAAARQSDPLSLTVQREWAWLQALLGRYDDSIEGLERIRAVDPDFPYVDNYLARALTFAGRPVEALRVLDTKKAEPGVQHWMARAYVMDGQRGVAERLAATHEHPLRLAVIHAALGDSDRAFEALDQAVLRVPNRVAFLLRTPEISVLRGDVRFDAVRKKLNLP